MKPPSQAGFTLVEMLVAVAVFVMVAFIVTSTFLILANANRKAQSIRLVMDNLNFALDSMALRMREGSNYQCYPDTNPSDPTSCSGVSFIDGGNNTINYFLEGQRIYFCSGNCAGSIPVTAPEVEIKKFVVLINEPEDGGRALAALLIKGVAGDGKTKTQFNIQTTVSERAPVSSPQP